MGVKQKFEFEEKIFDNGLWLGYKRVDSPDIVMRVDVDQGRVYEEESKAGITHLLEHMLFKGATKNTTEIKEELEKLTGRELSAEGDYDTLRFMFRMPRNNLESVIDLFFEMFTNKQIREEELEKEKIIVGNEARLYYGSPFLDFLNGVRRKTYPNHPYGELDCGTNETINSISVQDLIKLEENGFVGSNTKIVVVGNFDPDKLIKKVDSTFGRLKKGNPVVPISEVQPIIPEEIEGSFEAQPYISLSIIFQIPGIKDKDRVVMDTIGWYLGRGANSRLFRVLREENQICYSFGIDRDVHSKYWKDHYSIFASNFDTLKRSYVISMIKDELDKLRQGEIDSEALKRVKHGWLLTFYEDEVERLESQADNIIKARSRGYSVNEVDYLVRNLTTKDLQRAAEKYFNDRYLVVTITPK
ncbi:MAG: pitrilysin family protein [Candidatus Aenigmarchaeota archaeon]|nr:pitrilysin family protein [Candidatus Aenigmarchaeota archaeon]